VGPTSVDRITLVDAGLLTREQRGRWSFYRVVDGALDSLADALRAPTALGQSCAGSRAFLSPDHCPVCDRE